MLPLVIMLALQLQDAQTRLLPTESWPRTLAEWRAIEKARSARGSTFNAVEPDFADEFDLKQQWVTETLDRWSQLSGPYGVEAVEMLLDDLYHDAGHPTLNASAQEFVVRDIAMKLVHLPEDRFPAAARERLREGLWEYWEQGGGRWTPLSQAQLAEVLGSVTAENDIDGQARVDALLEDALTWADAVDWVEPTARICARRWGEATWLHLYDTISSDLPAELPERYKQAVRLIRDTIAWQDKREARFASALRRATSTALAHFADKRLEADLLRRLLLAYRLSLRATPAIQADLVEYLDGRLVQMLRTRRDWSEGTWTAWCAAVQALGRGRCSSDLQAAVRKLLAERKPDEGERLAQALLAEFAFELPASAKRHAGE